MFSQRLQKSCKSLLQQAYIRSYSVEVRKTPTVSIKRPAGLPLNLVEVKKRFPDIPIRGVSVSGCIANLRSRAQAKKLLSDKTIKTKKIQICHVTRAPKKLRPSVVLRVRGFVPGSDASQVREAFGKFGPIESVTQRFELDHVCFGVEPAFFIAFKHQKHSTRALNSSLTLPDGNQLEMAYSRPAQPPSSLIQVLASVPQKRDEVERIAKAITADAVERPLSISYNARYRRRLPGVATLWLQFATAEEAAKFMDRPRIDIPGVRFGLKYAVEKQVPEAKRLENLIL
ncbi:hypothetical protein C8J56DRAFT_933532 [Mycena floridula]|nr:hypothetical protein C8J56DRAFT_933532 [Mycena floridula]